MPKVHLLCNAHLDPVWLWRWHEGAGEALSTFRTAVEICEKNKGFIFNHNEAILYKWIAEYDPELFTRIKNLAKQKRWHIMGGWYLQPDCNIPSGESLLRQILKGKNFFKKHFDMDISTAIGFDCFGHSRGLVQILVKSGYNSYIFARPNITNNMQIPAENFRWIGFDGSDILAVRIISAYSSSLGKAKAKVLDHIQKHGDEPLSLLPWGVGNHGGGPSRKDIKEINELIRTNKKTELIHSTPEHYIKDLLKTGTRFPEHHADLNPWAVGCYTSMIRVKQMHRQLENELYSAEKMASIASANKLLVYPCEEFDLAMHDLLLSEFHDALPGSSIEPVEYDTMNMLSEGLNIAGKIRSRAFFALTSGQKKAKPGQIPLFVYNHHPYKFEHIISCEFNLADHMLLDENCQVDVYSNGKRLKSQLERQACTIPMQWRKKIVFNALLKPGQMNRFDCRVKKTIAKAKCPPSNRYFKFKNDRLDLQINPATGLVDIYKVDGTNYICNSAFEFIVIKDNADSWGMLNDGFMEVAGRFNLMTPENAAEFAGLQGKLAPVRIIETGPIRTIVEALFSYNNSAICQRYFIPGQGAELEIETIVHWNQKDSMLKMQIPVRGKNFDYIGQTGYGVQQLPTDGTEAVSQRWNFVKRLDDNCAMTCINDGIYGSNFTKNNWRLTLLRSPGFATHPSSIKREIYLPTDRYVPRMEQGVRKFRFWFNAAPFQQRLAVIDRESQVKNETLFTLPYFPSGKGKKPQTLLKLTDRSTIITAVKQAENTPNLIIRVFEPTGRHRKTTLVLPLLGKQINIKLNPFEIKTLSININNGRTKETNLMEE